MTEVFNPRVIEIDLPSARWAWDLGAACRATPAYQGIKIDRACPFRPGTPHREFFRLGWKGGPRPGSL